MNSLPPSRLLRGGRRWIPLALTVAVVSGCGLTGSPADFPTPSPPPSSAPPPLPPPDESVPDESVPERHCRERTRLPETVEVSWPGAAAVHRATGPDGTSVFPAGCRPVPWRA
ncbi:hypothetical protein [Streptomyces lydicus]|uniref:hypothetical protein n=1 Tax=Streptomyces lydicus TaxID=47763 RepID=UPI003316F049